jgi:DNA (cytosine-5)-methyltransferase 1
MEDGWITAIPGLSRAVQLKLLGNGVVPRQAQLAVADLAIGISRSQVAETVAA